MARPRIFIGSSSEGLRVARHFQAALRADLGAESEITVWDQGVFNPGEYTLEALIEESHRVDFAVLVVTSDDITESRGATAESPRDNVLFELGLFMGALGRTRVFILPPHARPPRLPSDLLGVTLLPGFEDRDDGRIRAGLAPAALVARDRIEQLGPLDRTSGPSTGPGPRRPGAAHGTNSPEETSTFLESELIALVSNARAQGWKATRTGTALRLIDRKGRHHTVPLARDPAVARGRLRGFAHELRAAGLRVNSRVREPVS